MATLFNTRISDTYVGLIKTIDNAAISATLRELSDGSGNGTGLSLNNAGDFKVNAILEFGSLKDSGENIIISKFVDAADGIGNNDNDTSIPTSAAVVSYVASVITAEDLDFRGDDSTVLGDVDLNSQAFIILGTANEIETSVTSAGGNTLKIGIPSNPVLTGIVTATTFSGDLNGTINTATTAVTQSAGDNSTKVATTAYVDTLDAASDLDFSGDSGTGDVTLNSQTFAITGTTNQVITSASGQTLNLSLPSTVHRNLEGNVIGNLTGNVTGNVTGDLTGNVTSTSVLANGVTATTQASSDSSTKVATTAFVKSLDNASDLDFSGNSGTGDVNLNTQSLAVTGVTNEILTNASNQGLTVGFPTSGAVLPDGSTATTQASSNDSTKIATTAYVKSLNNASDLDFTDGTTAGDVNLNTQSLSILGTSNQVVSTVANQSVTLSLPSSINVNSASATILQTARDISLTGEASGTISSFNGSANVSGAVALDNDSVTAKVLTGLASPTATNILASDSILQAFGKTQSQLNTLAGGLRFMGTWNATSNTPTLASGGGETASGTTTGTTANKLVDSGGGFTSGLVGDQVVNQASGATATVTNFDSTTVLSLSVDIMVSGQEYTIDNSPYLTQGHYYVVSVGGTSSLNGLTNWAVGDWVIAGATNVWEKLDHTQVDGTGTVGNITKWSSTNVIADSIMAESGSTISVSGGLDTTQAISSGGDFSVNTDKFTVNATTGNSASKGSLIAGSGASGQITISTNAIGSTNNLVISTGSGGSNIEMYNTEIYFDGNTQYFRSGNAASTYLTINSTGAIFTGNLDTAGDLSITNSSPEMYYLTSSSSHYNWMVAAQENVDGGFEITPSNAVGTGGVFDTPAFRLDASTRTATFAGKVMLGSGTPVRKLELRNINGARNFGIGLNDKDGTQQATTAIDHNTNDLITASTANIRFYSGSTIGDIATLPTNQTLQLDSSQNARFSAVASANIIISRDNMYVGAGQFYIGAENGTTDDTYRQSVNSGIFKIESRESGTWTNRFQISSSGSSTFAGSVTASNFTSTGTSTFNDTVKIEKIQQSNQFDTSSFLRLHPSATTDYTGYTNMIFGTDTANNYGVAIGGLRAGTDGTPSFAIRMLNDSVIGTEVLRINTAGNSTFSGTITSGGGATFGGQLLVSNLSNYTGLTLTGSGGSRPGINFNNVNNGVLGSIFGTESNAIVISANGNPALEIKGDGSIYNLSSTQSVFYGNLAGNIPSQTGTNNSAFGYNSLGSLTSGAQNVGLGNYALQSLNSGSNNIAIGYNAGGAQTTADANTYLGYQAGASNVAGTRNTIIGYSSADALGASVANYNVVIGSFAFTAATNTSNANVIIGDAAAANSTGFTSGVVIGHAAGYTQTQNNIVFVGYECGYANTGLYNVAMGYQTLRYNTSGDQTTAIGYQALHSNTTGDLNTAIGMQSLYYNTTASYNTAVGQLAGFQVTGAENTYIGSRAGQEQTSGAFNIGIGSGAMFGSSGSTASNNIGIGINTLSGSTTATQNTVVGNFSADTITTGTGNSTLGYSALTNITTGNNNVAIGSGSLNSNVAGSSNTVIGYQAGADLNSANNTLIGYKAGTNNTANSSVFIGGEAGLNHTSGAGCVFVGADAGYSNTTSGANTYVGAQAGIYQTGLYNSAFGNLALFGLSGNSNASYNTAFGYSAGNDITTGASNTFLGTFAGNSITTGADNIAIGKEAMAAAGTSVARNIGIGYLSLRLALGSNNVSIGHLASYGGGTSTTSNNVVIGGQAGQGRTAGADNVIIGSGASFAAGTGGSNVVIGKSSAGSLTSGANNTFIGKDSAPSVTSGFENIALGKNALKGVATGSGGIAIGISAGNFTSGNGNIAVGYGANGAGVVTGSRNISIGDAAGYNVTSGGNNILIGTNAGRTGSQTPQSMGGVDTASNQIQMGNESHTSSLIQVQWVANSDSRDKAEIKTHKLGLEFVNKLKPVTYYWDKRSKYENQIPDGTHIEDDLQVGFLAQDLIELEKEYGHKIEDKTNLAGWESKDKNKVGIQHTSIIPSLVKAIQELTAKVEMLENNCNCKN